MRTHHENIKILLLLLLLLLFELLLMLNSVKDERETVGPRVPVEVVANVVWYYRH